jgi:hypothetical protein
VSFTNFTNNSARFIGGAVYLGNSSRLILQDSLIAGNAAHAGAGLGVLANASARLHRVEVSNNTAGEWGAGLNVGGTAIVVVKSSMFHNNTSANGGGALFINESASCLMSSVKIFLNFAARNGGGINADGSAHVKLIRSNVTGNQAGYGAGIFLTKESRLEGQQLLLKGNVATWAGGGAVSGSNSSLHLVASHIATNNAERGGGVAVRGNSSCDINHCVLVGNTADVGGAIETTSTFSGISLRLRHSIFHSNVAQRFGGGINADTDVNTLAVQAVSCTFVNNTAEIEGGALCSSALARVTLTGQTRATSNMAFTGGGFARVDGKSVLKIINGSFDRNSVHAGGQGALVSASTQAAVVFESCQAQGSMHPPGVSGGAFYITRNATLNISSCSFSGLHAERGGCIAAFGNSSVYGRNCSVDNCTAVKDGGVLYMASLGNMTWAGGRFHNVRADGGAAINTVAGTLRLTDVAFTDGKAKLGGAILAEQASRVVMARCTMHDCSSLADNGGAMLVRGTAQVRLANCNISSCSSQEWSGGALAVAGDSSAYLHRCYFHHNNASRGGGAVVTLQSARVVLTKCKITDNAASIRGGGVCAYDNTTVQLLDSAIAGNHAVQGGGLWLGHNASIDMDSSTIELNMADWGGGVYLDSSRFSLAQIRSSVRNNKAQIGGDDLSVMSQALANTNTNSTIAGFVSRLGITNVTC